MSVLLLLLLCDRPNFVSIHMQSLTRNSLYYKKSVLITRILFSKCMGNCDAIRLRP